MSDCNCEAVTKRAERAEAKIVELVAYGEKRYQQWQKAEARAERLRQARRAGARVAFDLRAERNAWQDRAKAAEALLNSLADSVIKDAKTRGDADMRSVEIAAAHIRNQVEGYRIAREYGRLGKPAEGVKQSDYCPRCYADVEHEDDHLQGDKEVNCWYECPGDEFPTHEPRMKCDYCSAPAVEMMGESNGNLVCIAHSPRTPEQKIAFRKEWDARYEAGQKRKATP